jgi:uncharacterized membrane protein HdeD (DUF308 family)
MSTTTFLPSMLGMFSRNWWVLLLRGIAAMLFGLFAIVQPGITLSALVLLFGIYALIDGSFALAASFTGWGHRDDRWLLVLEGLVGMAAGIITLTAPLLTAVALIFFIAAWAMGTGILKIVEAIRLRNEIRGEFWLALSGIASVIFAFLVMTRPAAGALAMAWVIGWYALFVGGMLIMLSLKLRGMRQIESTHGGEYRRAA